jgi:ABC-type transport system substrate-binding protein
MSTAVDSEEWTRLFLNGRGVPAHSPLPPGIFGYESDYRNPFRTVDLDEARRLLKEAGYPGGIDPDTGKPLRLTFDSYQTTAQGLLQNQYFVNAWREIGLDVKIEATSYNQFQQKVRNGAYQIFSWGWVADYPDPENFLFLLTSEMARSRSGGPNTANFSNARYDQLFLKMKVRENDAERMATIREMLAILEAERPWIELFHPEDYALYHGWLRNVKPAGMAFPTLKYRDLDPALREQQRREWNRPVTWPAYALLAAGVAIVLPGVRTFFRERQ